MCLKTFYKTIAIVWNSFYLEFFWKVPDLWDCNIYPIYTVYSRLAEYNYHRNRYTSRECNNCSNSFITKEEQTMKNPLHWQMKMETKISLSLSFRKRTPVIPGFFGGKCSSCHGVNYPNKSSKKGGFTFPLKSIFRYTYNQFTKIISSEVHKAKYSCIGAGWIAILCNLYATFQYKFLFGYYRKCDQLSSTQLRDNAASSSFIIFEVTLL